MGHKATFGTEARDISRNSTIYVESLNGFPDPVSDVITLVTGTHYILTKPINCGINQLKVPDDGVIQISASNPPINSLQTELTGVTPFIIGAITELNIFSVDIISLNSVATCFNLSAGAGSPVFDLEDVTVEDFSSIGTLDGISFFSQHVDWVSNVAGLTLNNVPSANVTVQDFSTQTGDHYIITGTMTNGFFSRVSANPGAADSVFNIDSGVTTSGINIIDSQFDTAGGGSWFDAGGLDQTTPAITTLNNLNVIDSNTVGSISFTGNSTQTVLADTSTFVKVAGTYVDGDLERFTSLSGVITHTGLTSIKLPVSASAQILLEPGVETDSIEVSLFQNGAEVSTSRVQQTLDAVFQTPTAIYFNISDIVTLETSDTIEMRARNISNATNITFTDSQILVGK